MPFKIVYRMNAIGNPYFSYLLDDKKPIIYLFKLTHLLNEKCFAEVWKGWIYR